MYNCIIWITVLFPTLFNALEEICVKKDLCDEHSAKVCGKNSKGIVLMFENICDFDYYNCVHKQDFEILPIDFCTQLIKGFKEKQMDVNVTEHNYCKNRRCWIIDIYLLDELLSWFFKPKKTTTKKPTTKKPTTKKPTTKKPTTKKPTTKEPTTKKPTTKKPTTKKPTTIKPISTTKKPKYSRPPFPWPYPWPFPWPINYGVPWPNIKPSDSLEIGTENENWDINVPFPWPRQWPMKYPDSWNSSTFPWPWKKSDKYAGSKDSNSYNEGAFNNGADTDSKKNPDGRLAKTGDIKQNYADPWWPHIIPKSFMELCGNVSNAFCSDVLLSVMRECLCDENKDINK